MNELPRMADAAAFDWSLVRSFLAVADHGTLSSAARALGLSQPTLGRHVAELEERLGVPLFERTGRGLALTERGRGLVATARAMDANATAFWRTASGADAGIRGAVRITASQPVACVLLPPLLVRMRAELPEVRVELVVTNAVTNLLRREADIALRMVRPSQVSLIARRLEDVRIVACAHRAYLAQAGTPRRAQDLREHALIAGDRDGAVDRGALALGFGGEGARFVLRSDDLLAQWAAVRAGLGVGFVAEYVARTDPEVVRILPSLPLPRLPMWLTVHREIHGNARIRAVYDFLAARLPAALAPERVDGRAAPASRRR